jgi:hypothetical protein
MTAAAIALDEELTPEQQIYRAEKARRAGRVRPEMVAAAAELERIEQIARETGKGGRPKSPFNVGKGTGRRRAEPDPDAPGRPEWLTPPTPPKEPGPLSARARRPLPPTPTMPEFQPKDCAKCGEEFTPKGANSKFCTEECARAAKAPAAAAAAPKVKVEKPRKKRTPAKTAFASPRKTAGKTRFGVAGAIEKLEEEIAALDAQRDRLEGAIASLREFETA